MKTQYIARCATSPFVKADGATVFPVFDLFRITTAKALVGLVENTAHQNGFGSVTAQMIPITKKQFQAGVLSVPASALERVEA